MNKKIADNYTEHSSNASGITSTRSASERTQQATDLLPPQFNHNFIDIGSMHYDENGNYNRLDLTDPDPAFGGTRPRSFQGNGYNHQTFETEAQNQAETEYCDSRSSSTHLSLPKSKKSMNIRKEALCELIEKFFSDKCFSVQMRTSPAPTLSNLDYLNNREKQEIISYLSLGTSPDAAMASLASTTTQHF